jgi:hypothetical protein
VSSNINYLNTWPKFDLRDKAPDYYWFYLSEGLPALKTIEAEKIIGVFNQEMPLEQGLKSFVTNYLSYLNHINNAISQFNEQRLPSATREERAEMLNKFFQEEKELPVFKELITIVKRNEMQNLWLILRY